MKRRFPCRHLLVACLAIVLVAGCAADDSEKEYVERPVEDLYNEAMDLLEAEQYTKAASVFDEVERQHPYSAWATYSFETVGTDQVRSGGIWPEDRKSTATATA